ncbi:MAG TPA: YajQ family cyclic di-GMP-binding protein [Ignavibacteria bacterium]|nr:YajQ family cyclic di-GMP-binding protein [Ignavibacteria bacterium]HMQ99212.1 YajQ family cyclic di-GMP-binding protein [Ignavibacteria bacterium]
MADNYSFDIVSEIDWQEVDNAINQTRKEILSRYDFKGSKSTIEYSQKDKTITILADDDYKSKAIVDMMQNKFVKRSIPLKSLKYKPQEEAGGNMVRQIIEVLQGINKENAKLIVKIIKDSKIKVQAAIQDEQVRVSSRDKDLLQQTIQLVKNAELDFAVQFTNYR